MSMLKLNDLQRPTCNSTNTIGIFEVNVLFLNFSFLLSSAVIFAQDFVFVLILKTEKHIWRERRTAGPAALHAVVVRRGRAGKNTEN